MEIYFGQFWEWESLIKIQIVINFVVPTHILWK